MSLIQNILHVRKSAFFENDPSTIITKWLKDILNGKHWLVHIGPQKSKTAHCNKVLWTYFFSVYLELFVLLTYLCWPASVETKSLSSLLLALFITALLSYLLEKNCEISRLEPLLSRESLSQAEIFTDF